MDAQAAEAVGDAFSELRSESAGGEDVVINVAVSATYSAPPHPLTTWCTQIEPRWWDGEIGPREKLCIRAKSKRIATPEAPNSDRLKSEIVHEVARLLESWRRDRWTLYLSGRTAGEAVTITQGDLDRSAHVEWKGREGTLTCLPNIPAAVTFRECRVPASAADPLVRMDRTRTFQMGIRRANNAAVDRLTLVPDEVQTVGLVVGEQETHRVTLSCGGEPRFDLSGKDVEVSPGSAGPQDWSWAVRPRNTDGLLTFTITSSVGGQVAPATLGVPFKAPWYRRLWKLVIAAVGGLAVLAKGVQEIVKALKTSMGKSTSD